MFACVVMCVHVGVLHVGVSTRASVERVVGAWLFLTNVCEHVGCHWRNRHVHICVCVQVSVPVTVHRPL